jgi:hypothetical protein
MAPTVHPKGVTYPIIAALSNQLSITDSYFPSAIYDTAAHATLTNIQSLTGHGIITGIQCMLPDSSRLAPTCNNECYKRTIEACPHYTTVGVDQVHGGQWWRPVTME